MWPISELAGQLGEASSWRPVFALAIAIAESGHLETPAKEPSSPGGRIEENLVMSCSPSALIKRMLKGEKLPALLLTAPASKWGWKGATPPGGQGPPPTPLVILKLEVVVSGWAGFDQGVKTALVV